MTQRRFRALTILASSLVLPLLSITISFGDVVTLTADATTKGASGGLIRGTVISESPTKVEVKLGNTTTPIPTNEIVSISYDSEPASMEQAKLKEAANALAEAADLYKKAATEAASKPFIAEDATFGQVRVTTDLALSDPAKATEAMTLLETFSRNYKNGRHILPALETLAKLQLAKENYSGLDLTLGQLSKLPGGEDRASLFRIKILTRKGNLDQAIGELDKAIAAAPEGSAKKRDAQLAKAESLVAQKKVADAEALLKSVIKAAPAEDSATQAAAHNALGDCLKAAGRPKEALYAYLHTDLLFSKEKDEHARALAQLAQLWRDPQLNRPDRAEEVMERLKQEYPRSPYLTGSASPADLQEDSGPQGFQAPFICRTVSARPRATQDSRNLDPPQDGRRPERVPRVPVLRPSCERFAGTRTWSGLRRGAQAHRDTCGAPPRSPDNAFKLDRPGPRLR